MRNISGGRSISNVIAKLVASAVVTAALVSPALAAECPRKGTLGTSRVLEVDPAAYPRVGLKNFPQTLPLEDHEVILTFDDGPEPVNDRKVLAALSAECVHATFFMVGRPALGYTALVRKIAALGHTIGYHTFTHANLKDLPPEKAEAEIDKGIAAIEKILHGQASTTPSTPFFRFPYFDTTPHLLDLLEKRGIAVFGADLWAADWENVTSEEELKRLIGWLGETRKGIILLHDPRARTADMLPAFLRYLREHHYRVVHIVPIAAKTTANQAH